MHEQDSKFEEEQHPPFIPPILKLMVIIVDWDKVQRVTKVLEELHARLQYVCTGEGTASSEILDMLGIGSSEKGVVLCLHPSFHINILMQTVSEKLELAKPGNGIAFTMPLSGASNTMTRMFTGEKLNNFAEMHGPEKSAQILELFGQHSNERCKSQMEKEAEKMNSDTIRNDLIVAVIDQGYSDELMDAARSAGARSGTIIHARRTGMEETIKFFGISVQTEKEIVAILTGRETKIAIMKAINQFFGSTPEAKGIVFSMPVDSIAGLQFS